MALKGFKCMDCGKDTSKARKDYYMLTHDLWEKINPQKTGMLCMDCCEKRLGRKLEKKDLLDCELNKSGNPYTKRLTQAGNYAIREIINA